MINFVLAGAYLGGSVAFAIAILHDFLKNRQKKLEPKLKMENYPHV